MAKIKVNGLEYVANNFLLIKEDDGTKSYQRTLQELLTTQLSTVTLDFEII